MPEGYRNKWEREHRSRIIIIVEPDRKDTIRQAAEVAGQSINSYINQAIQERMERENKPE